MKSCTDLRCAQRFHTVLICSVNPEPEVPQERISFEFCICYFLSPLNLRGSVAMNAETLLNHTHNQACECARKPNRFYIIDNGFSSVNAFVV